jgi:hypothetical protein
VWSREGNNGNKRRILYVAGQQGQVQGQAQDGMRVVALSRRAVDKEMVTPNLVPVSFVLKSM